MELNSKIWFNYFKFIIITISLYYPKYPNDVSKKKYYNLIQNLPVFFPHYPLGPNLLDFLEFQPLTPYLDSRESFIKWVYLMINKLNKDMGEKQNTFETFLKNYYKKYKPPPKKNLIKKTIYSSLFILILFILIFINFL